MKNENYATHIINAELSITEIGVKDLHKIKAKGNSNNSNREFRIIYPCGNRPKRERVERIVKSSEKRKKCNKKISIGIPRNLDR